MRAVAWQLRARVEDLDQLGLGQAASQVVGHDIAQWLE